MSVLFSTPGSVSLFSIPYLLRRIGFPSFDFHNPTSSASDRHPRSTIDLVTPTDQHALWVMTADDPWSRLIAVYRLFHELWAVSKQLRVHCICHITCFKSHWAVCSTCYMLNITGVVSQSPWKLTCVFPTVCHRMSISHHSTPRPSQLGSTDDYDQLWADNSCRSHCRPQRLIQPSRHTTCLWMASSQCLPCVSQAADRHLYQSGKAHHHLHRHHSHCWLYPWASHNHIHATDQHPFTRFQRRFSKELGSSYPDSIFRSTNLCWLCFRCGLASGTDQTLRGVFIVSLLKTYTPQPTVTSGARPSPNSSRLCAGSFGLILPHTTIGIETTLEFWIRRRSVWQSENVSSPMAWLNCST